MQRYLLILLLLLAAGTGVEAQWTQTPGPAGGYIRALVSDGDDTYVGFWSGAFFWHDGTSWSRGSNVKAANLMIAGETILATTVDNGIVRSTDRGATWNPAATPVSALLARDGGRIFGASGDSIYSTADGGATWQFAARADIPADVLAVRGDTLIVANTSRFEMIRSADGGRTWQTVTLNNETPFPIFSLVVAGNAIYALANQYGVYRSADGGATWSAINQGLPEASGNYPMFTSLAASGSTLWGSTITALFRFDGTEWEQVETGEMENALFHTSGNSIYSGSRGGVFRSTDAGVSWNTMNPGLVASAVTAFGVANDVVLCNSNQGIFRSTDLGGSWIKTSLLSVDEFATAPGIFYARAQGYTGAGIIRSTDGGISWTPATSGITEDLYHISALAATPEVALAGFFETFSFHGTSHWQSGGIFRSVDGGLTWSAASTGLPHDGSSRVPVFDIATDGATFLATTVAGLFRSTDAGRSWSAVHDGLPTGENAIWGELAHDGRAFYLASGRTMYRSADGGRTWERIGNGLPDDVYINTISVVRGTVIAHTYSTTAGSTVSRIYRLQGDTWGGGIANVSVLEPFMRFAAVGNRVLGGTAGLGVWSTPLDAIADAPEPEKEAAGAILLEPNLPNPFTSGTSIRFILPARMHVRLSITDAHGKEVAQLADRTMDAGEHLLEFDAAGLPSGTYFTRLVAGGKSRIGRMLLVR